MTNTFWVKKDNLDEDQRRAVIDVPYSSSILIQGPAGSGKTNILLLRAKLQIYKGLENLKIIAFTNSLCEFIKDGCNQYDLNPEVVVTQMKLFKSILQEYSIGFESTDDFETDRIRLSGKIFSLIDSGTINNSYFDSILVDEAQDYSDTELIIFSKLAKVLILASDSRQSIYRTEQTRGIQEKLVSEVIYLRHHYRCGLKLCKLADAILPDSKEFRKIQSECKYSERQLKSSVTPVKCDTFEDQLNKILKHLEEQISLYPGEKIGILFPKKNQVDEFKEYVSCHSDPDHTNFYWIDTLHGSKGWEFRAVHIAGTEALSRMGPVQKRLIYTGILRGKTSLHIYWSGHLPGYLGSALATLEPPKENPQLSQLF